MICKGGLNSYGYHIAVLGLDTSFAKGPGHIKNAYTFDFPVVQKVVKGAKVSDVIGEPEAGLIEPFIKAAKELERDGIRAITGSCGFMAAYQKEIADAVNIPIYISSLIQVPLVSAMLGRHRKVGVVVASKDGLTPKHLSSMGITGDMPICVAGMEGRKEFWEVIVEEKRMKLDMAKLQDEITSVAGNLVRENPDIGALVLECTDMPPFAHIIHQQTKIPVFDLTTLTKMVYNAVVRLPFQGPMPDSI